MIDKSTRVRAIFYASNLLFTRRCDVSLKLTSRKNERNEIAKKRGKERKDTFSRFFTFTFFKKN